jgi:GNAT superfamily N-acetyltransferase
VAQLLFSIAGVSAVELMEEDLPGLQSFFEANPEYFLAVNGMAPHPGEARLAFDDRPPEGMSWSASMVIGFRAGHGRLLAMASVLSDLFAPGVWHVGLFIVDGSLHGSGLARDFYEALERWAAGRGARYIRLGAVAGNAKAERFWEKMGFHEVRRREGQVIGERTHAVRVFVKAIGEGGYAAYLRQVPRDRPE